MLNRVREQLVKPVVDALDLERLPEVASRVEQELSRLSLAPKIVLDPLVMRENVVRRLDGHVPNVALYGISEKPRMANVDRLTEQRPSGGGGVVLTTCRRLRSTPSNRVRGVAKRLSGSRLDHRRTYERSTIPSCVQSCAIK